MISSYSTGYTVPRSFGKCYFEDGFLIMMGTVMLTQGVRKVPIHSTRRSATVGPFGFGRFRQGLGKVGPFGFGRFRQGRPVRLRTPF